jgi:hypothetical protein
MPLRTSIQLINTTPPGSSVHTLELAISAWENHESQDWTLFSWYADLILEGSGVQINEIIPTSSYANDYFNADLSSDKTVITGFGFTGSPFASTNQDLFRIGSVLIQLDQVPSTDQPLKITLQAIGNRRNKEGTISLQTVAASKQLFPGVSPSSTGDLAQEIGTITATIDDSLDQPLVLQGSSNTAPNLNSNNLILSGTEDQPLLVSVDKLLQELGFSDTDNDPPALKFTSGAIPNLELYRNYKWINIEEETILDDPEEHVRWLPPANQAGDVDLFSVTGWDGKSSSPEQAVISVKLEPIDDPSSITGDTTANTKEDNSVSGDLDATDTEGLTNNNPFSISDNPSNGSASIDAATGAWTYTPNADFNGSDSFIVSITDDLGGTTKQAVNISVAQVNDLANGELNFAGSPALGDTLNLNSSITDVDGVDPERIRYRLDRMTSWSSTWETINNPWSPTVHVLTPNDLGQHLRISASYTDAGGTAELVKSAPLLIPYPEPSINGSSAAEQLLGSDADDTISAAGGADSLLGFSGNDQLDGGSGWDILNLRGPRVDYILHKLQEDLLRLSDSIQQRDGTDLITGIEQLQFTDQLLAISDVINELPVATTDTWKADLDGDQLFSPISDGLTIASHFLPATAANLSSRAEVALGINSGHLDFNRDKLFQTDEADLLLRFGFGTFPGRHLNEGLEIATSLDQLATQLEALL